MLKISKIRPARPKNHMDMGHKYHFNSLGQTDYHKCASSQPFTLLYLKIINIVAAVQVFSP